MADHPGKILKQALMIDGKLNSLTIANSLLEYNADLETFCNTQADIEGYTDRPGISKASIYLQNHVFLPLVEEDVSISVNSIAGVLAAVYPTAGTEQNWLDRQTAYETP